MNATPTVDEVVRGMIADLRAMGNPERARGVQQYFKHAVVSLGLDAPTLRSFARERIRQLKPSWTASEAVAFCDRLLQEPEMDVRGAGILILGGFHKTLGPDFLPTAKLWLRARLDNWALVDAFSSAVLSPLLGRHPSAESTLRKWSRDKTLWVRRAALVTLVPFARRGRFLDLAYELATNRFSDREDLMHKATGWLLREAGKTDMARLRRFLLEHGPRVPRTSLRYSIERFPASERAHLLAATRLQPGPRTNRRRSQTMNLRARERLVRSGFRHS